MSDHISLQQMLIKMGREDLADKVLQDPQAALNVVSIMAGANQRLHGLCGKDFAQASDQALNDYCQVLASIRGHYLGTAWAVDLAYALVLPGLSIIMQQRGCDFI